MSICVEQLPVVLGTQPFQVNFQDAISLKPRQQSSFSVELKRLPAAIFTWSGNRTCFTGVVTSFWLLWWGLTVHLIHLNTDSRRWGWIEYRGPLSLITNFAWIVDASFQTKFFIKTTWQCCHVPWTVSHRPLTRCGTLDGIHNRWDFKVNFVEVIWWTSSHKLSLKLRLRRNLLILGSKIPSWINNLRHKLSLISRTFNNLFLSINPLRILTQLPLHLLHNQHLKRQNHQHLWHLHPHELAPVYLSILERWCSRWRNTVESQYPTQHETNFHHLHLHQFQSLRKLPATSIHQMMLQHHINDPIDDPGPNAWIQTTWQTSGLHPSQSSSSQIYKTNPSFVSTTILVQKKTLHVEKTKKGYVDHSSVSLPHDIEKYGHRDQDDPPTTGINSHASHSSTCNVGTPPTTVILQHQHSIKLLPPRPTHHQQVQSRGQWKDYPKSSYTSNASGWIDYTKPPASHHTQYDSSTKPLTAFSPDSNTTYPQPKPTITPVRFSPIL